MKLGIVKALVIALAAAVCGWAGALSIMPRSPATFIRMMAGDDVTRVATQLMQIVGQQETISVYRGDPYPYKFSHNDLKNCRVTSATIEAGPYDEKSRTRFREMGFSPYRVEYACAQTAVHTYAIWGNGAIYAYDPPSEHPSGEDMAVQVVNGPTLREGVSREEWIAWRIMRDLLTYSGRIDGFCQLFSSEGWNVSMHDPERDAQRRFVSGLPTLWVPADTCHEWLAYDREHMKNQRSWRDHCGAILSTDHMTLCYIRNVATSRSHGWLDAKQGRAVCDELAHRLTDPAYVEEIVRQSEETEDRVGWDYSPTFRLHSERLVAACHNVADGHDLPVGTSEHVQVGTFGFVRIDY